MAYPGPHNQQPYSTPQQQHNPYQQAFYTPPTAQGPGAEQRRRFGLPAVISIGVVCFIVGLGFGAMGSGPTTSTSSAPAAVSPAAPPPVAREPAAPTREVAPTPVDTAPALVAGTIPNGQWIVPDEVAPGRYRSTGPEEGFIEYCQVTVYDANGNMLEWKNAGEAGSQVLVTVSENAAEVHNSGCGTFTPVR